LSVPTHSQLNILCAVVVIFGLNIKLLSLEKDVSSAFFNKPHSLIFDTISVDSILPKWAYALHWAAGWTQIYCGQKPRLKPRLVLVTLVSWRARRSVKKCEEV
jgi:hypothetical protein